MQRILIVAFLVVSTASLASSAPFEVENDIYSNPWQSQYDSYLTPQAFVTNPGNTGQQTFPLSTLSHQSQLNHVSNQLKLSASVANNQQSTSNTSGTTTLYAAPFPSQPFAVDSWGTYCRSFDSNAFLTGFSRSDALTSTSKRFRFQKGLQSMATTVKNAVNPDVKVQLNSLFRSAFSRYKKQQPASLLDIPEARQGSQLWGMIIQDGVITFTPFESRNSAFTSKDYDDTFAYFTLGPTPAKSSLYKQVLYCSFIATPGLTIQDVQSKLGDAVPRPTTLRQLSGDFKSWLGGKLQKNLVSTKW